MTDYVNISVIEPGFAQKLLQNSLLNFDDRTTKNGNVIHVATYKKMKFEVYAPSMKVEISGSFHYLYNDGLHNHNDFKRLDLYDTVIGFCERFSINPKVAILHGFEFGVNIKVPFEPLCFIERVLSYKAGTIKRLTQKTDIRKAIKIQFDQYRIKIYSKSDQFSLDTNILRFEIKVNKMVKLDQWCLAEAKTLQSLLIPTTLSKLGKRLISEFDNLLVYEPLRTEEMTAREKLSFDKMTRRSFWEKLPDKSSRSYHKRKFKGFSMKYGDGLKESVSTLIREKWSELLETGFTKGNSENHTFSPGYKATKINKPPFALQAVNLARNATF